MIDGIGHLDLSSCFQAMHYDMLKVEQAARLYFFTELQNLTAWDGTPIKGMNTERKFLHLACKHGKDNPPLNPLLDLDIERIKRLPTLKRTLLGEEDIDIYRQINKRGKEDKLEPVVSGEDRNYIVVLGVLNGFYIVRSAYPAGNSYAEKTKRRSKLIGCIRQ